MNKKGFVLMETVIVLLITVVSMLGLFTTYSYVVKDLKEKNYYDNVNDLYKLNVFYKMLIQKSFPNTDKNYVIIDTSNCSIYFGNNSNCSSIFNSIFSDENYQNYKLIYLKNVDDFMINDDKEGLTNTDIEYIKKIDKKYGHLILAYQYAIDDKSYDYYASLKVIKAGDLNE